MSVLQRCQSFKARVPRYFACIIGLSCVKHFRGGGITPTPNPLLVQRVNPYQWPRKLARNRKFHQILNFRGCHAQTISPVTGKFGVQEWFLVCCSVINFILVGVSSQLYGQQTSNFTTFWNRNTNVHGLSAPANRSDGLTPLVFLTVLLLSIVLRHIPGGELKTSQTLRNYDVMYTLWRKISFCAFVDQYLVAKL